MHARLARHLKRLGLDAAAPPGEQQWRALLEQLSAAADDNDRDRYMLERSISISSREMQELYAELKRSSESQLAVERDRLHSSLAVLNATLETGIDGVLLVGTDGNVVLFNARFLSIFGVPADCARNGIDAELLKQLASRCSDPDGFLERVQGGAAVPGSTRDEIELVDGRVIDRYSAPVRVPEANSLYGRVWVFRDVTAERRAVEEAQRVNAFLDSIIENLPEMVFVKDAETLSFVRFNRAGEELLGWSKHEFLGRSDHDFFPPDQAVAFVAKDREVLAGREIVEILDEAIDTRAQGTRVLCTKKIPILDAAGRPKYLLGISHDVTEIRRHAEELKQARDAAEAANRAKSEFLANMSHELRTPLNAIIGFAEVLSHRLRGPLNERQTRDVEHILDGGRHLLGVINEILDLARVEAGRCDLHLAELDVLGVMRGAAAIVSPLAEKKKTIIGIGTGGRASLLVRADELRLRQILINLLSNAVKFTPDGGHVWVSVGVDDTSRVVVSVRDDGIGIAVPDQERIFGAFEQVDSSHARRQQGTGLGLALTRRLVELHGGRIWVESEVGMGSVFHFTLEGAAARIPRAS